MQGNFTNTNYKLSEHRLLSKKANKYPFTMIPYNNLAVKFKYWKLMKNSLRYKLSKHHLLSKKANKQTFILIPYNNIADKFKYWMWRKFVCVINYWNTNYFRKRPINTPLLKIKKVCLRKNLAVRKIQLLQLKILSGRCTKFWKFI